MNIDEDDEFRKHVLGLAQLITFALALFLLAAVYYSTQQEKVCGKNEVRAEGRGGDVGGATEDAGR